MGAEGRRESGRHAKAGEKEEGGLLRCQCYVHTHGKAQNNNPSLLGRRALGLSRGMVFRILEHSGLSAPNAFLRHLSPLEQKGLTALTAHVKED